LDLSQIPLTDTSMVYLSLGCTKLEILDVSGTLIGDVATKFFARYLRHLQKLIMDDCKKITSESLMPLTRLSNLSTVSIKQNPNVTQSGLMLFLAGLATLKRFDVTECALLDRNSALKITCTYPNLTFVYNYSK
jgi:hypothetical protein